MIGKIVGGTLGFLGGAKAADAQSDAAKAAAKAQAEANKMAIEESRRQFDLSRETLNPFVQAGLGGLGVPTNAMASAAGGATMTGGSAPAQPMMMDPRDTWPDVFVPKKPKKPRKGHRTKRYQYQNRLNKPGGYNEQKAAYDFAVEQKKKRDAAIKKYDRWFEKQKEQAAPATGLTMATDKSDPATGGGRKRTPSKQVAQAPAALTQAAPNPQIEQNTVVPTEQYATATPQEQQMLQDGGLLGTYAAPNPVSYAPQGGLAQTAYQLGEGQNLMGLAGAPTQFGMVPQWQQNPFVKGRV